MVAVEGLVREGDSIVFRGDVLEVYVPKSNFDRNLSEYNGDYINTIGIFVFQIKTFEQAQTKTINDLAHYSMKIPIKISFQYSNRSKYVGPIGDYPSDEYEVFILEDGNKFLASSAIEKSSKDTTDFIQALHNGGLPKMLTYDEILKMYHLVLELTGVNLKAPSLIYELTISESCRSKDNVKKPFRETLIKKPETSRYDYRAMNISKLAMLNSTFGGLTFENSSDAVLTSIERTITGEEEQDSPLERIARY